MKERLGVYVRPLLVSLGLSACYATIILWAIFQGLLLPSATGGLPQTTPPSSVPTRMAIFYLMLILVSALAAIVVNDLGRSLGTYVLAYILSGVIVYSILVYPEAGDPTFGPGFTVIVSSWTFQALFPITLFVGLLGTIAGWGLGERILG